MQPRQNDPATADAAQQRNRHPTPALLVRAGMLAAALALAGCATLGVPGSSTAAADSSDTGAAQLELAAGISQYDKGEYVAAIRTLLTSDQIWRGPMDSRVTAQKYVAFSHCLLNRPQPCKQSFSDLLRMKPDFDLAAAEAGHPQWGAAFRQAKREASQPVSRSAPSPAATHRSFPAS